MNDMDHHGGSSSSQGENLAPHLFTLSSGESLSPFSNVNKRATTFLRRVEHECSGTLDVADATKKSFLLMPPIKVNKVIAPFSSGTGVKPSLSTILAAHHRKSTVMPWGNTMSRNTTPGITHPLM